MDLPDKPGERDPAQMRASDADRDRVADRLREALAEGRLTADEHAERLDLVYRAKTYAELAPVVADLPATGVAAPPPAPNDDQPPPRAVSPNVVAILSGAERKGRWLVDPHVNVVSVMGGVDLDLRQAVLSQREVTIDIVTIAGGVSITVPPGVRVIDSVACVLGGCTVPSDDPTDPDAPVIRLTGMSLLGGVDVKRKSGGGVQERLRQARREFRDQRRELRRARRHGS